MAKPLHRRLRTGLFYALRTAFRITPMPEATRDKLRQRFLDQYSSLIPLGPKGQVSEGKRVRRPYVRSDERAIGYVPYSKGELPDPLPATLVAFYLPQFHTIPENDEWWGKGFTEWRNVTRALPQFEGHYQPKLPGDLGFYDLRNVEVMREQARLAREYGVSAFCFYFYWFGGKTLLETPLRNWLNDKTIDLQFCLCWANEKWTRTWDGRGEEILIDQKHSPEDDIAFIEHVAEYMRDQRYLRVDGKPMLLVYRPGLFPNMGATAARWRKWCVENGIGGIHLAYVQSFERPDPRDVGFDAAVEFPPNLSTPRSTKPLPSLANPAYSGEVLDWRGMAAQFHERAVAPDFPLYRGVNPCWDNEARRPGRGRTFLHSAPRAYRDWLQSLLPVPVEGQLSNRPFIFINAWNEWAEGAILEPDTLMGYANLEATRRALLQGGHRRGHSSARTAHVVIHAWYADLLEELIDFLPTSNVDWHFVVSTSEKDAADVKEVLSRTRMPYELFVVGNRGRDILPFLQIANSLVDRGVDLVLKVHTKRSPHLRNGDAWRHELLQRLTAGKRAATIIQSFSEDPTLGMVGPEGHMLNASRYVGANREWIDRLTSMMGLHFEHDAEFPSGSMFWTRLQALRPILDLPLRESDFESENLQRDGTLAHAIERVFGSCTIATGYKIRTAASICGEDYRQPTTYPYA